MSFGISSSRAMEYNSPEEEIEALCKNKGKPMLPGARKRLERNVYQKWAERDQEMSRNKNSQIGELRTSLVQQLQPGGPTSPHATSSNEGQYPPTRPASPAADEQLAPPKVTSAELFEGTLSDIEDDELTEEEEEAPEENLKIKIPALKRSTPGSPWNATLSQSTASAKGKEKEITPAATEASPPPSRSSFSSRIPTFRPSSQDQAFITSSSTALAVNDNPRLPQLPASQPFAGPSGFIPQPAPQFSRTTAQSFDQGSGAMTIQADPPLPAKPGAFGSTSTSFSQASAPLPATQPKVFAASNTLSAPKPTAASFPPAWPKPATSKDRKDVVMDADAAMGDSGVASAPARTTPQDFGFPQASQAFSHTAFRTAQSAQPVPLFSAKPFGVPGPAAPVPVSVPAPTFNTPHPSSFPQPQQQPQRHVPQPSQPPQRTPSVEVEMVQEFTPSTPISSLAPQWATFSQFQAQPPAPVPTSTFVPQAPVLGQPTPVYNNYHFGPGSIVLCQHQAPPTLFAPLFQQPAFLQGMDSSVAQASLQMPSWTPEVSPPEIPVQRTECALQPLQPSPPRPDILGLSSYTPPPSPPRIPAVLESADAFEMILARENEIHTRWQSSFNVTGQSTAEDQVVGEVAYLDVPERDPYKLVDFRPQETIPKSEKRNIRILEDQRREAARVKAKQAARLARKALRRNSGQDLESREERGTRDAQRRVQRKDKAAKPYDRIQVRMSVVDRRESKTKPKTRPWGVFGLQYA